MFCSTEAVHRPHALHVLSVIFNDSWGEMRQDPIVDTLHYNRSYVSPSKVLYFNGENKYDGYNRILMKQVFSSQTRLNHGPPT